MKGIWAIIVAGVVALVAMGPQFASAARPTCAELFSLLISAGVDPTLAGEIVSAIPGCG